MKQVTAAVSYNRKLAPGISLIWLNTAKLAASAKPGQFVMVRCGEDAMMRRPVSIHRIDGDSVALLVRTVGKGTEWLVQAQMGVESLDILGPLGNGFSISPKSMHLLLIAGGIGIAPLYFLAEEAAKAGKQVTLLFGAAKKSLLRPLSFGSKRVMVIKATDDGSAGYKGLITDLIPQYAESADQVFACGPVPMLKYLAQNQEKLHIKGKPFQISMEMRMGCGIGVCYSCTIRTRHGLKQVCKDGPVFQLDDVIWDDFAMV